MKKVYTLVIDADDPDAAREEIAGALQDTRDSGLITGFDLDEFIGDDEPYEPTNYFDSRTGKVVRRI